MSGLLATNLALMRFADAERGQPFVWGWSDCASLSARALEAMGHPALRTVTMDQWYDEETARQRAADPTLPGYCRRAGLAEVSIGDAAIGDILLAPAEGWLHGAHMILGRYCLSSLPLHGVSVVPTSRVAAIAVSAWRAP